MNQAQFTQSPSAGTGWQLLGVLRLPLPAGQAVEIEAWLADTLRPLGLNADLLEKIQRSAGQAQVRAGAAERDALPRHLELVVFAAAGRPSGEQTWGFFQLDKAGVDPGGHTVAFYLYGE